MFSTSIEPKILRELRESSVLLHLTGSRFFGGYKTSSDYDFFCEDTEENRALLILLAKWTEEQMELDSVLYNDSNTVAVWVHHGEVNVHIQFVRNVDKKLAVQRFLTDFPFSLFDKKQRKYIWNWAYRKVK